MLKKIGIILAAIGGFFLALFLMNGGKGKGDALSDEAKLKREKADLIDAEIARIKAEMGKLDEETKKEIERIKKLDDLEEISREFDKI